METFLVKVRSLFNKMTIAKVLFSTSISNHNFLLMHKACQAGYRASLTKPSLDELISDTEASLSSCKNQRSSCNNAHCLRLSWTFR